MILVAESGSTKTNWVLINGVEISYIDSEGYNPYYMSSGYIRESINLHFTDASLKTKVLEVHFYGAGCSPERKGIVQEALSDCFENAKISVESDLLAAARCLLGKEAGFAAILGTGTNSCFYNGSQIVEVVDSLGFLAGDEGSGAYLGKKIIKAYIRGYLPHHLESLFVSTYGFTKSDLITALYDSKSPNKFTAQFSIFAGDNIHHEFIKELVKTSFRDFFLEIVVRYKAYKGMEIRFVGSVAFVFSEILKSVATEFEMKVSKINKNPLQNLVYYHAPSYPKSINKKYL
jgi:N-acetylglucosamine kinase-like BadF-type ATPase